MTSASKMMRIGIERIENILGKVENADVFFSFSHNVFKIPSLKTLWEKEKRAISPIPTVFSIGLKNFLPFSSCLKLSFANSLILEVSEIRCSGKG